MRGRTLIIGAAAAALAFWIPATAHDPDTPEGKAAIEAFMQDQQSPDRAEPIRGKLEFCINGKAGKYPCDNVHLLSTMPLDSIGGGQGNDIWGWTDRKTGHEYALVGRTNGTAFVDVTHPLFPKYLGNLPSHRGTSTWRDIKVYENHAFVVADLIERHGMQVFDLRRLRGVTTPQTFTEDAHYAEFGPAHNIAINRATGFAYAVGSNTCKGGLHMVDISEPTKPRKAGCVGQDGYTHDTQCVVYRGPDADYQGRELCFSSNEDTVTIVDVTNKARPVQVSRTAYNGASYTHQGWLARGQRYWLQDDELDEMSGDSPKTRTYVFDLADLDDPKRAGTYIAAVSSIDHNQYVKDGYTYQANYQSGLRILDLSGIGSGSLTEVGYFDIYPKANTANFNGSWSVYPYFDSRTVVISGIEQGLIVVRPVLPPR
jgi:choice-of-anchor B domain-containing protein